MRTSSFFTLTIGVSSVNPSSVGPGSGINSGVAATIGGFSVCNGIETCTACTLRSFIYF